MYDLIPTPLGRSERDWYGRKFLWTPYNGRLVFGICRAYRAHLSKGRRGHAS